MKKMSHIIYLPVITIILAISLAGCTTAKPIATTTPKPVSTPLVKVAITPVEKEFTYKSFSNDKHEFSIMYPDTFIQDEKFTNSDGHDLNLISVDGKATLNVAVVPNNANYNTETEYDSTIASCTENVNITYKALFKNWFVVSYVNQQGNIIYREDKVGKGKEAEFVFMCPTNQKEKYEKVIEMFNKSFVAFNLDTVY